MTFSNSKAGRLRAAVAAIGLALAAMPAVGQAADQDNPNAAAEAEKARLEAETNLINARAARDRARLAALGLPSFEGTTTANGKAGSIEAGMLSMAAVRAAAGMISARLPAAGYILLAGDEDLDFSRVGAMLTQMDAIKVLFDQVPPAPAVRGGPVGPRSVSPTLIVGAISAAAGLLRSNVDLNQLDTPAVTDEMLATAIASNSPDRAVLPSALIGVMDPCPPSGDQPFLCIPRLATGDSWANLVLLNRFNRLIEMRAAAGRARATIPANAQGAEKRRAEALDAAIGRFDTFYTSVTSADDAGRVPIGEAGRLDLLRRKNLDVVRVHIAQSGGSLVKTTNLLTTLGADPLRVSGALIARYTVTSATTGRVSAAGILTCQTSLTSIRRVQQRTWTSRAGPAVADCQE